MSDAAADDGHPRVLVAGVGNIFLGDDGFGSEVVRHLTDVSLPDGVRVADYGIGGIHLAYDVLSGCDALVLVDALPTGDEPGVVHVVEVAGDDVEVATGLDAHSMDPQTVLASVRRLGGQIPPTFVVGCQPVDVSEGIGLSPTVAGAVEVAVSAVTELVDDITGRVAAV